MVMKAVAMATNQVGVRRTTARTIGMRTSAVRTRVPVMDAKEDIRYRQSDRRKDDGEEDGS
jgi:hypothetical protein